LFWCSGM